MTRRKRKVVSVPLVGSIRFARQMPRVAVQTLCLCEPLGGGIANGPKDQAFLDLTCGLPARMFDAERGITSAMNTEAAISAATSCKLGAAVGGAMMS